MDLLQAKPLEDDAPPKPRKPQPLPQPSSFSCPQCNTTLGVTLQKKRTVVQCPECGNGFVVQRPPPPPTAAAKAAEAAEAAAAAEEPEWLAAAALQLRKEEKQARRKRAEKEQRKGGPQSSSAPVRG